MDDEELDMDEVDTTDPRPESDFAAQKYDQHAHQVDGPKLAAALERTGTDDPNVRELITIVETIRQAYGDKDELLARYAEELEAGIYLLTMELRAHPGVWFARTIASMSDKTKAREEIALVQQFFVDYIQTLVPDGSDI